MSEKAEFACIRCFRRRQYPPGPDGERRTLEWFHQTRRGVCVDCEAAEATSLVQGSFDDMPAQAARKVRDRFEAFHLDNPAVYRALVKYTRQAVDAGVQKLSVWDVANRLRWHMRVETVDSTGDERRLNNDYLAYFSRLIMAQEPDLAGVFDTRTIRRTA